MKMALKNLSANCFRKFKRLQLTFQVVSGKIGVGHGAPACDPARGGTAMTFKEVLAQVLEGLQHDQRLSYRAVKRQFALTDDYFEDLKDALLYAYPQVRDDGRGLVWTGDAGPASAAPSAPVEPSGHAPLTYTPPYLAEKLLAS